MTVALHPHKHAGHHFDWHAIRPPEHVVSWTLAGAATVALFVAAGTTGLGVLPLPWLAFAVVAVAVWALSLICVYADRMRLAS